ncbi:uncharacterized protein LOC111830946 [Capsella rubella]|uniref:uncharacterized protein LOC111830946 n=1 Tax=Capsella rubella TaxID=81985 RepID=UPI000CD4E453|nr:uncharacterized protein LOC111830946 [Capsella rubella]
MTVGEDLGKVHAIDIDAGRVRVSIDGFKPLAFESVVEIESGIEFPVTLRYERLFGYYRLCSSLCHDEDYCGLVINEVAVRPPSSSRDEGDKRSQRYRGAVGAYRRRGSDHEGKQREPSRGRESGAESRGEGGQRHHGNNHEHRSRSGLFRGEPSNRTRRYTSYAALNAHRRTEIDVVTGEIGIVEPHERHAVDPQSKKVRKAFFHETVTNAGVEEEEGLSGLAAVEEKEEVRVQTGAAAEENQPEVDSPQEQEEQMMVATSDALVLSLGDVVNPTDEQGYEDDSGQLGEWAIDPMETEVLEADSGEAFVTSLEELALVADGEDDETKKKQDVEKGRRGKNVALAGASSEKRIANMVSTPRKRSAPKSTQTEEADNPKNRELDKGGNGGPKPPKPKGNK